MSDVRLEPDEEKDFLPGAVIEVMRPEPGQRMLFDMMTLSGKPITLELLGTGQMLFHFPQGGIVKRVT